jgi:FtsZ-binding cell division protein ZapB
LYVGINPDIDDVAEKWKARNILAIQLPQEETFEAILRREQQKSRELRREETELHRVAECWREKVKSLHGL